MVNRDKMHILYQKFKINKITQDRAKVAQTEMGIYGADEFPTSPESNV